MRRKKRAPTEEIDPAAEVFSASPPTGWLTSKGTGEVLSTAFAGACLLLAVIAIEYGMLTQILGIPEALDKKLTDKWFLPVMAISGAVGFAVAIVGWGLWLRVMRWMVARIGAETFNRTRPLRMIGAFVLVALVGLSILGVVYALETSGF